MPEINYSEALLRSLKVLQDTLGLLHDAYVNGRLVDDILLGQKGNETLRCEGTMLCGRERARTEKVTETLPYLWENLHKQLSNWCEDNL